VSKLVASQSLGLCGLIYGLFLHGLTFEKVAGTSPRASLATVALFAQGLGAHQAETCIALLLFAAPVLAAVVLAGR
ncbi:unnamed protein product, partial [Symbiodinium pilosum]